MKILLDSNFMMIPFSSKVDIYEKLAGHELLTLKECIDELRAIMPAAVELAEKKGVKVVDEKLSSSTVDNKVIEFAHKHNTYIATIDKELKSKGESKGIPVLTMRQGRQIVGF